MKLRLTVISILSIFNSFAQIDFLNHNISNYTNGIWDINNLVMADADNDGDLDVFYATTKVIWQENIDGLGSFGDNTIIMDELYDYPVYQIDKGDFNNDGFIDIVVSSFQGEFIKWLKNDGLGNFEEITIDLYRASKVIPLDFDYDGDLDIITTLSGQMIWYENDGYGNFASWEVIVDNSNGFFTDFDSDGDLDFITTDAYYEVEMRFKWYENDGNNNFNTIHTFYTSSTNYGEIDTLINVFDKNNDGYVDLLVIIDNKLRFLKNNGNNTYTLQPVIMYTSDYQYIKLIDFDSDGDIDFVRKNGSHIFWYENTTSFQFSEHAISTDIGIRDFFVEDLDNDQQKDLIITKSVSNGGNQAVWFKNIDNINNFDIQKPISRYAFYPSIISSHDLNGDGYNDVIVRVSENLVWYNNSNGNGSFVAQKIITTDVSLDNQSGNFVCGDIDNDNDIDIIVSRVVFPDTVSTGTVWYENDGLGNFTMHTLVDGLFSTSYVLLSDVDADSDLDIIHYNGTSSSWYENDNTSFTHHPLSIGGYYTAFQFKDIDGDGNKDVINDGGWSKNEGDGNFSAFQNIPDLSASTIDVKDIDGDGDFDIIYGNYTYDVVGWLENIDGLGNFTDHELSSSNILNGIRSIKAEDIDNDGDVDIISASRQGENLAWFENIDGLGNFSDKKIISNIASETNSLFIADINTDGKLDILSTTFSDNHSISWYENFGLQNNSISGTVRLDSDLNGCDDNDIMVSNIKINTNNSIDTFSTFTNSNGTYQFFLDQGQYDTYIDNQLPNYFTSTPAIYNTTITGNGNAEYAPFCIEAIPNVKDIGIIIYPTSQARPGFISKYRIAYTNHGTVAAVNGTVLLEFNNTKMDFLSASETVTSQSINTLLFDYTDLLPFETRYIDIRFDIFPPPTTNINETLTYTAAIEPIVDDLVPSDNTFSLNQTMIGSYDPNDISCLEGKEVDYSNIDDYLHYIIRFQNTGTASAINIVVTNELDANLDWSTFQIESISHSNRVEIKNGNNVNFIFDNINLVDSTTNEPASHGFITYKIKPIGTISVGEIIPNMANIYFDFNPPIITNTATTEIVDVLPVNNFLLLDFTIYPNPTNSLLNIKSKTKISKVSVYNTLGQLVFSEENTSKINIYNLKKGIYIIKIIDANGSFGVKQIIKSDDF